MIAVLQDSPQTLDGPIPEVLKQGEIPTAPTSSPYTDATDFYYESSFSSAQGISK
jgi:hypothetical protein